MVSPIMYAVLVAWIVSNWYFSEQITVLRLELFPLLKLTTHIDNMQDYESLLRPEEFSNIKHVNIGLNQHPLDNLTLCKIVLQFPINSQHWLLFSVICDYYFNTSIVLSSNAGYAFLCQCLSLFAQMNESL